MNKQNVLVAIVAALAGGGLVYLYGPDRQAPVSPPVERSASAVAIPSEASGHQSGIAVRPGGAALAAAPVAVPHAAAVDRAREDATRPAFRSSSPPAGAIAYGPFEATFFTSDFLNDNVEAVLASEQFKQAVDQLRGESDAHGAELQEAYRMELEDALRSTRAAARVSHFACASNLCMGAIEARDFDWMPAWQHELGRPDRLPMPSLSLRRVAATGPVHSLRFMFTTRGRGGFVIKAPSARAPG